MQNCDVVGKSNNIVVLFGSEGEMWTTTYKSACKMYKAYSYNTVVELASTLNERVSKYESENVVDWIRVSCQDNTAYCAVFVPSKERGILQVGIGKGQAYNEPGETSDPDPNNTSAFRTLNMRNAYNFGQSYRRFPLGEFKDSQYGIKHGELNCKCTTGEKISIPRGRYVGVCRHCGKMLAYTDDDLSSISPVSVEYLDVIDRLGVVACSSCAKCGGSIRPVIPKDDNNYDLFSAYLSDMSFAKRYVEHIYSVCMRNSNKYNSFL